MAREGFLVTFYIVILTAFVVGIVVANESDVLLNFKSALNDSSKALTTWNRSTNHCEWKGVTCSIHGHTIGLELHYLSVSTSHLASIIQSLPQLSIVHITISNFTDSIHTMHVQNCSLQVLDLSNNKLNGSVPTELLKDCKNMRFLNLSHNSFSGAIPPFENCWNLRYLDLSHNQLMGEIPQEILTNCIVLEELSLAYNNLSGTFPSLSPSSSMQKLMLTMNLLTGIQIESGCANLTELDISFNNLSGKLFPQTNDMHQFCPSLALLNISTNSFSASFSSLFDAEDLDFNLSKFLPSLQILDASFNNMSGKVPIADANLKYLDFSSNMFSTSEDSICTKASKLQSLLLTNNRLTGKLLNSVVECSRLEMLDLSFNSITGDIPYGLCDNLPRLQHLHLWANNLQGTIPSNLAKCSNLTTVLLSFNNLQGTIPSELSQLNKLWMLTLSNNMLSGRIPSSIGALESLTCLQLSNNSLEGQIPMELGKCTNLLSIELSGNLLTGSIPPRIGRNSRDVVTVSKPPVKSYLSSKFKFVLGSFLLPKCKGAESFFLVQGISSHEFDKLLASKSSCHYQLNNLSPYAISISSPLHIDFSYNLLDGVIPAEFGKMEDLVTLSLSWNFLTGVIPEEFAGLKGTQAMDLSHNFIEGRIPDALGSLHFLQILDLSFNNLSGSIPQKGQLVTFPETTYEGNQLCGLPLPPCSSSSNTSSKTSISSSNEHVLAFSFGMGFIATFIPTTIVGFIWEWEKTHCLCILKSSIQKRWWRAG